MSTAIVLYLSVLGTLVTSSLQQTSPVSNRTHKFVGIPGQCQKYMPRVMLERHQTSYVQIYKKAKEPLDKYRSCWILLGFKGSSKLNVFSLRVGPFESTYPCREIKAVLVLGVSPFKSHIYGCKNHVAYHHKGKQLPVTLLYDSQTQPFSITMAVTALKADGTAWLHVSYNTKCSGTISPFGFDGVTDYALRETVSLNLYPPAGHAVMLSFPHFHTSSHGGCKMSHLLLLRGTNNTRMWNRCGALQPPPELHPYAGTLKFFFFTKLERGFSGFKIRFSFHSPAKLPEKTSEPQTTVAFNCSVPFYDTFNQHLDCNLETECVNAEDESKCPYQQGNCHADLLNAGGKCYKYIRTRKRMTWYDASSTCVKQGLTLASFPTAKQGEAFREAILYYAPTTFSVYFGLRTSDSSVAAVYKEVWRWSSGVMAYYVQIDDQRIMFKPTCAYFAVINRHIISTTMCGFFEYMHYIFCETDALPGLNHSLTINLPPVDVGSSIVKSKRFVTCPDKHVTFDFLACDHMSKCAAEAGAKLCVTNSSTTLHAVESLIAAFMYICDSQTQTIHYTQVCDHQPHCLDSSDEDFCVLRACSDSEKQCSNKQCVTEAQWCDGMPHCTDESDEACPQFVTAFVKSSSSTPSGFHVLLFDSHGKYKYVSQGSEFPACPPTHFVCVNRELCIPVYLRCNGVFDCPTREDENNCEDVKCPGYYRCRASRLCVHLDHVCDGLFQCPQRDDELLCQLVCPDSCRCQGLAFVCPHKFHAEAYSDLRYIDSSGSGMTPDQLFPNHYLVRLDLSRCALQTLPTLEFPNLKILFLDKNVLITVNMHAFLKLLNLNFVSLSGNPITQLAVAQSWGMLKNLHFLDLSHTKLREFESAMLLNTPNLNHLNLSYGMLNVIRDSGFRNLMHIESLDLRGSELTEYPLKMLQSLSSLRLLFSDVYKLCCQEILPLNFNIQNCYTSPDEIASCKDLLRSDIYRMFLWISCCFALIGNAGSFAAKLYSHKGQQQTSFNVFIIHLNVSDFFMGLYLTIVGSADLVYRGSYLWHDKEWKTSRFCQAAGFFSLLSCETSAFIICLITLDRFIVIRFPFSHVRFRNISAKMSCGFCWVLGIAIAAVPLLPAMSSWEFYSQTGICIPFPITTQRFKGHFYSFGILIVFNFLLFALIAVGQMFIYMSIRTSTLILDTDHKTERENRVARRLLTVVLSDFMCWFPIGLSGLLAYSGVSIPGEVNVAMAIFALPLNSALNPFLYTFNLILEKRRKAAEKRLLKVLQSTLLSKTD